MLPANARMRTARFSLLRMLADGRIHAREQILQALGISEAELGALATDLEALDVRVLDVERRGLKLEEPVDLCDPAALAECLKTAFPDLSPEWLDECPSTNTALAARARAGAAHGTVLVCEHQSAGRGRRGNAWVSAPGGGVTFSLLWRFSCGAAELAGLSLAVAVGAAKALEALGARDIAVKWPNDLFSHGSKLGGILVETAGEAAGPTAAVVGVGINLRLSRAARERIGRPATDIATVCGSTPSRTAALGGLILSVASSLELFSREGLAPFRQAWLQRHAWQGRRVVLSQADTRVAEGEVVGIAEDGALELASEQGIRRFHSGELSLRLG